jgi:hypothetical protein
MTDSVSKMFVFQVELCLYSCVLAASCHFAANYASFLHIPAIVFMCLDAISVMLLVHVIAMAVVFTLRRKYPGGVFTDSVAAEVSQGFAVVSSLLWVCLLSGVYLDLPYVTASPGGKSSASAVAIAVVLGFYTVVPFLALVSTYVAVPEGGSNSLLLNGSTLGAASLMFLVLVCFGSVGATRCPPFGGSTNRVLFTILVVVYWILLVLVEMAVLSEWDPLGFTHESQEAEEGGEPTGWLSAFKNRISYWRGLGCLLDIVIVATSLAFSHSDVHGTAGLFILFIIIVHIPPVFGLEFETLGRWFTPTAKPQSPATTLVVDPVDGEQRVSMPDFKAFPFNAAASSGINSRVSQTLPRQRRGASTDSGVFY